LGGALRGARRGAGQRGGRQARAYAIARGELSEAIVAVEIASETCDARPGSAEPVLAVGNELYAVLSKLIA